MFAIKGNSATKERQNVFVWFKQCWGMAQPRLGRPPVPPSKKRVSMSVTLEPPIWKKVEAIAQNHGVSRSQIFDDALKSYMGELDDLLRHLREELAGQEENSERQEQLIQALQSENQKLRVSQAMVGNILSPYGGAPSDLNKEQREKARVLRALRKNESAAYYLGELITGRLTQPPYPIYADAFNAWGSWQAILDALKSVQEGST